MIEYKTTHNYGHTISNIRYNQLEIISGNDNAENSNSK